MKPSVLHVLRCSNEGHQVREGLQTLFDPRRTEVNPFTRYGFLRLALVFKFNDRCCSLLESFAGLLPSDLISWISLSPYTLERDVLVSRVR